MHGRPFPAVAARMDGSRRADVVGRFGKPKDESVDHCGSVSASMNASRGDGP